MKRNAPEEFAAQAGIHPTRTNQTQLTRHDVHYAPAARNESHPEGLRSQTNVREHSEKPSKHRLARLQVTKATCKTSEGHTFRSKLPLGKHRQLVRKSKPTRWQLPEGHAFRKAPSTREAQTTRRRVQDNLKAITRGTWRNAPVEFAAQAGIRPTRTNRTQLTRHDVHCAPAPQSESPPEGLRSPTNARKHLERPSKHRLARMKVTSATGNFRGTYFSQQASTRKA